MKKQSMTANESSLTFQLPQGISTAELGELYPSFILHEDEKKCDYVVPKA